MNKVSGYRQVYENAWADPATFWADAAKDLHWYKRWDKVLDTTDSPHHMWFKGAECNMCHNAVDRHVQEGRGEDTAILFDSAMTGEKEKISYATLQEKVAKTAGMLQNLGVCKGDRVVIYMPMIPEAVYAMLGVVRLGGVHSVVFGGFAAGELASRILDSQAKVLMIADVGYEPGRTIDYQEIAYEAVQMVDEQAPGIIRDVVVWQRELGKTSSKEAHTFSADARYCVWQDLAASAEPVSCVPVRAEDPLYILYTSGSTGAPKGIERAVGGHMVALHWSMRHIYNCKARDVFWAASDFGWIVGHSYIVYGPLLAGCTTLIYEGKPVKTPDAGAFFRVIEEYKVNVMFTAPTAFRAIRREDPQAQKGKKYDISSLRAQFLAGERCDVGTLQWTEAVLGVPVIDHWWQTETGWAITSNFLGFDSLEPVKQGSAGLPVPGYDIRILDTTHEEVPRGEMGDVCIKLPLPPSFMTGLWGARERFVETYMQKHPGYYTTGDAGYMDEENYLFIMARTDDVINVAGHRLSTSAIEETLISHEGVVEAAAVGKNDDLKGQVPVAFIVSASYHFDQNLSQELIAQELIAYVRQKMGAVVALRKVYIVEQLPKTRSGKILRGMMQKIVNGEPYTISPTIENMQAVDIILKAIG